MTAPCCAASPGGRTGGGEGSTGAAAGGRGKGAWCGGRGREGGHRHGGVVDGDESMGRVHVNAACTHVKGKTEAFIELDLACVLYGCGGRMHGWRAHAWVEGACMGGGCMHGWRVHAWVEGACMGGRCMHGCERHAWVGRAGGATDVEEGGSEGVVDEHAC
ncbi:unnamed protein product [Closterium sp. NIES-54]